MSIVVGTRERLIKLRRRKFADGGWGYAQPNAPQLRGRRRSSSTASGGDLWLEEYPKLLHRQIVGHILTDFGDLRIVRIRNPGPGPAK